MTIRTKAGDHTEEQTDYYMSELAMEKDDLKGKLMLDTGCGNGKMTNWFAQGWCEGRWTGYLPQCREGLVLEPVRCLKPG